MNKETLKNLIAAVSNETFEEGEEHGYSNIPFYDRDVVEKEEARADLYGDFSPSSGPSIGTGFAVDNNKQLFNINENKKQR